MTTSSPSAASPNTELIANYIRSGLLTGAGAGLGVSLLSMLSDLQRRARGKRTTDDDTLYMDLPGKMASFLRAPIAIVGGTLAVGGAYMAVRAVQQALMKRKLERELEEAQHMYLDSVNEEASVKKAASLLDAPEEPRRGLSLGEGISAVPLTLGALTALASGVVSYNALRKYFPDRKSPLRTGPKRVVLRAGGEPVEEIHDLREKSAAAMLFDTVTALRGGRGDSDFDNVMDAVALGRIEELRKTACDHGVIAMLDAAAESRSGAEIPSVRIKVAARAIAHDATMRETVLLLAAAEMAHQAPTHVKMASTFDDDEALHIVEIAARDSDRIVGRMIEDFIGRRVIPSAQTFEGGQQAA